MTTPMPPSGASARDDVRRTALFGIAKLNVPRSEIPPVTHLHYSAGIQSAHADTKPNYHALLPAFNELTGCLVIVNISFNCGVSRD
jgi:carbamoyltransferase